MNDRLPARIDDLPASLIEIAEVLGARVAIRLIEHFGGLDVKFPVKPKNDHPVIKALGEADAYALCLHLKGHPLYVPHGNKGTVRADIVALSAAGHSDSTIARRLKISQRHVRRVLNGPADPRQRSIFD